MSREESKVILMKCQVPGVGGWCNKKWASDFGRCALCYEAEEHLKEIAQKEAAKPGMVLYLAGPNKQVPVDTTTFSLKKDDWNTLWGSNLKLLDGSGRNVASVCKGLVSRYFEMTEVEKNTRSEGN